MWTTKKEAVHCRSLFTNVSTVGRAPGTSATYAIIKMVTKSGKC